MEYTIPTHSYRTPYETSSVLMYASAFVTMAYAAFKYFQAKTSPLASLPTIGYSGVLTSYITAMKFLSDGHDLLQQGYETASCYFMIPFNGKPFKVATPARWLVVLGLPQHIQDLSVVSDEIVSVAKPPMEANQAEYTFGPELLEDPYHVDTIRGPITRNLTSRFEVINDETITSLQEYIPPSNDWTNVAGYDTLLQIMCRTTSRFYLGLKLCRDPHFQDLTKRLTLEIVGDSTVLGRFPRFLRPAASRIFGRVKYTLKECRELLEPLIVERLEQYEQKNRISEKTEETEDTISWFIETSSQDYHRTIEDITRRVMMIHVASLHAPNMTLTQAVFDLAIHPEYVKELREEAAAVIAEYGWTKRALQKMSKVDSFLKESHRMNSISHYLMIRETLKDFRLSDGTLIPVGAHIGIASGAINKTEKYYQDADTFKGMRFAEMREGDEELDPIRYQMVSLSPYSVMFGHGKHACPGRFFAIAVIKTIFTHILLEYDVQLENGSMNRPPDVQNGILTAPNPHAKLRFRKRSSPC